MAFFIKNNATGKYILVDGDNVAEVKNTSIIEPFSKFGIAKTVFNSLKNDYPDLEIVEA